MYETATNLSSCESDTGKWNKPGKSELPSSSWLLQSIRMGCAACDRRRVGVCYHQAAANGGHTAAATT